MDRKSFENRNDWPLMKDIGLDDFNGNKKNVVKNNGRALLTVKIEKSLDSRKNHDTGVSKDEDYGKNKEKNLKAK
jgi:hypothetical protein